MREINLLGMDSPVKRRVDGNWRTQTNREIARKFDREFFDGDRANGYGGYLYDGRWRTVSKRLQKLYEIKSGDSFLDIGCAKGFLLYDMQIEIPGIKTAGIDVSEYAINHAMEGYGAHISKQNVIDNSGELENKTRNNVLPNMIIGDAKSLPFADDSFDVAVSINTLHNLPVEYCKRGIAEMIRVTKGDRMFIQVDSYTDEEQKKNIMGWNLTAKTILSTEDWLSLFRDVGYRGDYFWTLIDAN